MRVVLSLLGIAAALVSAWFFYVGFSVPTVSSSDAAGVGIANLQAMHIQMADIVIGVGAAIVAAVALVGTAVVGAVEGGRRNFND